MSTDAKAAAAVALAERLLKKYESAGAPGTEVEHLRGCSCEDLDTEPAIMYDERTVTGYGLAGWVLSEIERRLRVQGRPLLRWRKNRWNAAGEQIGPELAIRSCEVQMLWEVIDGIGPILDRVLSES